MRFEMMAKQFEGFQSMMQSTLDSLNLMGSWQASADKAFGDLRDRADGTKTSLDAVSSRIDIAASRVDSLEARLVTVPASTAPIPHPLPALRNVNLNAAPGSLSCSPAADGERAKGHGEHCGGILGTRPQDITGGTFPIPIPAPHFRSEDAFIPPTRSPPFPKIEFPKFDGENPRLWRENCEMFFEVYATHPSLKTRFAALNFKGAAASWLQTVQRKARVTDWDYLCELVMSRFDRGQYQLLLNQFENLKQKGTVLEYQSEFEQLAHGLMLYNDGYDDTYFVNRFLIGLRDDIRAAITLHQPKEVATASILASLQEEELSRCRAKGYGKEFAKGNFRALQDKCKAGDPDKPKAVWAKPETEDKLATLREFRRKNGLCFKCGGKWDRNHKCPAQVPIHVVEELLDALETGDLEGELSEEEPSEEVVLAVGKEDSTSTAKRRTLKLQGTVGKVHILILVDSGSVGTFISDQLAQQLQLPLVPCTVAKFVTADGSPMLCNQKISNMQWSVQGNTFITSVGILPLKCFDMILGQDWLEEHSPMWVHWSKKLMRFTRNGVRVQLQGITKDLSKCPVVTKEGLRGLLNRQAVTHCIQFRWCGHEMVEEASVNSVTVPQDISHSPELQKLLEDYGELFQTPTTLPPTRPFDHHIQLAGTPCFARGSKLEQ